MNLDDIPAGSLCVIDTNVLLYDPDALLAFPGGEVIVPITVIEEIDQFKGEMSETGRNAHVIPHPAPGFGPQPSLLSA